MKERIGIKLVLETDKVSLKPIENIFKLFESRIFKVVDLVIEKLEKEIREENE